MHSPFQCQIAKQLLLIAASLCFSLALQMDVSASSSPFKFNDDEKTTEFWLEAGRRALEKSLRYNQNENLARNSILFIGDGMSLTTITAARILQGQMEGKTGEEGQLSFEALPNVALVKTYNLDQQIPDSAATATAILSGVKANFYTLGVNGQVKLNDTNCAHIQQNRVTSILEHAIKAGKSAGIVTNTRITHATPAAGYAHTSNRRWECETPSDCKDIASQLIEEYPGNKLNVILGGGRRCFFGNSKFDLSSSKQRGLRLDNKDLIESWTSERSKENASNYAFVNSTKTLREIDFDRTDYLLGLFSYSHMSFEELRDRSDDGEPSLAEMTLAAIRVLKKNPNGYLLLIESGRIDHSHHENVAGVALRETIALSWAVKAARDAIDERDTLLAVTADHAHALTINGLAPRGNPILGLSRFNENSSQLPYTTLIYGNGPGHQSPRNDPSTGPNSTDSPYYVQYAAIHQDEAFHDGSDVGVFAAGPFAHLFQGVQEQSYIGHVISYAMCIGEYSQSDAEHCDQRRMLAENDINGSRSHQNRLANGHQSSSWRKAFLAKSSAPSALSYSYSLAAIAIELALLKLLKLLQQ